jgi:UDP-N-acetylmuramate dehydrogenase
VPLHDKNWFKTGGAARYFSQPQTATEFAQALAFAQLHTIPVFILGQGANILISDQGFDGLVIRPDIKTAFHVTENDQVAFVTAGAGMTIHDLINYCLDHNIVGLEEFSGIPGTVGGSV